MISVFFHFASTGREGHAKRDPDTHVYHVLPRIVGTAVSTRSKKTLAINAAHDYLRNHRAETQYTNDGRQAARCGRGL